MLPLTLGDHAKETTININFILVLMTFSNAILGRVTLHALQAVMSTYHQCMKFPMEVGICTIKGSQRWARECYYNSTEEVLAVEREKEGLPHSLKDQR